MKITFVETSCIGCAIRLVAFPDRELPRLASMYITTLSNHHHLYMYSWKGRLRTAWRALIGEQPEEIGLDCIEDIEKFKAGFEECYNYLKDVENDPTNETK